MTRKMILFIAVLAVVSLGARGQSKADNGRVLSLCDMVDNWKNYHQQTIRVRAVFAVGPEMGWLYDPACKNGQGLTDVEIRKDAKGAIKKLDQLLVKEKRAWVVLEGVFYGPEVYQNVDPKLPPAIRERLEKSPRRYGHMDTFQSMIDVTRVIEATKVAAAVPAGKQDKSDTAETLVHEGVHAAVAQ
jgi:hypothetical protein